jgi:hypothetical protein
MITNPPNVLNFRLLRYCQCIINLDPEITRRTFQFCMTEKKLYCSQIFYAAINQSRFSSSHRVGAIGCWLKAYHLEPAIH